MNARVSICQLFDIFDYERVLIENADGQNVFQLRWRVSIEVPDPISPCLPFRIVDADAEPVGQSFPLIEVPFDLVQFTERCFAAIVDGGVEEALC